MKYAGSMIIAAIILSLCGGEAHATATLSNMDEVGAAIEACWNGPDVSKGSFVTLQFSFRRDGTLIGVPRPTAIDVPGDAEARQSFVSSAITALEHCTPLHFSPFLADNIAGRVFTMQFFGAKD
jgi:hypothetical protein